MALRYLVPFGRSPHEPVPFSREIDPFISMHREMNDLFENFWRGFGTPSAVSGSFSPRVDVEETETELRVTAELPGLEEKDFQLELEGNVLVLHGEKQEERERRGEGWYERSHGSFRRTIPLSVEVDPDRVSASFKNGTLRVALPKTPAAQERSRRIPIETS